MATEIQIVNRTASILNASGAGQTVESEDYDLISDHIPLKLRDLNDRGVIGFDDIEDMSPGAIQWFSLCLANDLAPDFGKQIDSGSVMYAEKMLRVQGEKLALEEPVKGVYY